MERSFSNIIFIILAVVIFIGRTVVQAKKKKAPPPKKPAAKSVPQKPKISVHFEDDKEPDYFRNKTPARVSKTDTKTQVTHAALAAQGSHAARSQKAALTKSLVLEKFPFDEPIPAASGIPSFKNPAASTRAASPERGGFANLTQLSPLKQAVVMAEILGPPKSLQ